MEKAATNSLPPLRFIAILAVTFFLYYHFSMLNDGVQLGHANESTVDPCWGRYIYVYKLPPRFNTDIIRDCRKNSEHWPDTVRLILFWYVSF